MGDLAFLLLIFFIVTSSFILRQGIFLSLPSKSVGSKKIDKKNLINIYPTNRSFIVDGKELTRGNLIIKIKEKIKSNGRVIAIITMEPDVKYDRLVDALSVSKESGITQVSLKNTEFTEEK